MFDSLNFNHPSAPNSTSIISESTLGMSRAVQYTVHARNQALVMMLSTPSAATRTSDAVAGTKKAQIRSSYSMLNLGDRLSAAGIPMLLLL